MADKIEVWVVMVHDNKRGTVIEKTRDKEIVRKTVENIQTVEPSKWSRRDGELTGTGPMMVDVPNGEKE